MAKKSDPPKPKPKPPLERHYPDSRALCRAVHNHTDGVAILGFSGGKDSVATYLRLVEMGFTRIIPFHLYTIPGLEFVEVAMRYYEKALGIEIVQLPHPRLPRMLKNLVYQPPERAADIEQIEWPSLDHDDINEHMRKRFELPDAYVALGIRTADSPARLVNVKRFGSLNPFRRTFFPVYDWRLADVKDAIVKSGLKLSHEYHAFSHSFDGIDFRFTDPIRRHFPKDYKRILEWFPLAHLDIDRRNL